MEMIKKFDIIGPDGFSLKRPPDNLFATREQAEQFIPVWCERYKQQGYYSTASLERISLNDLPGLCEILEVEGYTCPHCGEFNLKSEEVDGSMICWDCEIGFNTVEN